jgi:hypothetical protein
MGFGQLSRVLSGRPRGKRELDITHRLWLSSPSTERIKGLDFRHYATPGVLGVTVGFPGDATASDHMWGVLMTRMR